jgi:hypothetical protein
MLWAPLSSNGFLLSLPVFYFTFCVKNLRNLSFQCVCIPYLKRKICINNWLKSLQNVTPFRKEWIINKWWRLNFNLIALISITFWFNLPLSLDGLIDLSIIFWLFGLKNAILFLVNFQDMSNGGIAKMVFFGEDGNTYVILIKIVNHRFFNLHRIICT